MSPNWLQLRSRLSRLLPSSVAFRLRGYDQRQLRDPTAALISAWLAPGLLGVDVGAYRGRYTAAMVRAGADVVAIEANPSLSTGLARAAKGQGVQVVRAAAGDADGQLARLTIPRGRDPGFGTLRPVDGDRSFEVPTVTLDRVLAGREPSLIKIDVEGAEFKVLDGARGALASNGLGLIVEVEERHLGMGVKEALDYILHRFGFRAVLGLSATRIHDVGSLSLDAISDGVDTDLYVNNFLLVSMHDRPAPSAS